MVFDNIEELLEKYDKGESSLKEEQQLKDYFSQETVAPHLEVYQPLFNYFLVDKKEQFTKQLPLKTKIVFNYKWLSVAAVAVLMLSIFYTRSEDEFSQQEIALAQAQVKSSLELISKHFNKGASQVGYLDVLQKGGSQVGYLEELKNPMGKIFKN